MTRYLVDTRVEGGEGGELSGEVPGVLAQQVGQKMAAAAVKL